ncbi:response regulator [Chitinophaga polysaccharea]|uniref:hybrid sensor histidine kinase/response regulator transcription factor n=1 Tax=Chitinophaga polysaccharea TaxID=1293035 RepID=UPI001455D5A6|nr:hybrid sensor histidine kinase/response regulator transcription factor [Chitinophaga polysaccharea]NLR60755.1 response regulator [Chitinophaga polysaccharea]
MLKTTLLISLLLCFLLPANAQEFSSLNVNNGLSNNQVNCIFKDNRGFMWFGTMSGLNRYDGFNCRVFRHSATDSSSISDDYVTAITSAPGNRLFIRTRNGDVLYDPVTEQFTNAAGWLKSKGLPITGITALQQTSQSCWIGYQDGNIYQLAGEKVQRWQFHTGVPVADITSTAPGQLGVLYINGELDILQEKNGQLLSHTDTLTHFIDNRPLSLRLFTDAQLDKWIYMPGTDFGVVYINGQTGNVRRLTSKNSALNNDIINGIVQDEKGYIWIGTDHGGINVLNKADFSCYYLRKRAEDVKSIAENTIYTLYKDNLGIIWCGTYKRGVSYYAENMMKFSLYVHKYADPQSLSYNDVNCFTEDRKGNIWIGSNGGGLIYFDRQANTFSQLKHDPGNDNSISSDVILSLFLDSDNSLWIGYYFGGLDHYNNGRITHYRPGAAKNSLGSKSVWKIYKDSQQNFWIGTLGGGLDRFDQSAGLFYHNNANIPNSVHSNFITDLAEDRKGSLWIGTAYGIDVLDKAKGVYIHYLHDSHQLSNDNTNSLLCDSRGIMWVGTRDGLNAYDPDKQQFIVFRMKDGLPDNNIISILEDNDHHLWVSTSNGLSKITVLPEKNGRININCHNYDEKDGLQGNAFNINAALKLRSGELLFGGYDGFNIFNPAAVKPIRQEPPIVFTSLQLFNRTIAVNETIHHHVILPAAMPETREIVLRHDENDFSIDFATLDFTNTDKNRYTYAYKLEGFNKEWQTTDGKSRRINYTNINPGNYTLYLRVVSDDQVNQWKGISLHIRILPPFWATPLAYITYLLLITAILLLLRKIVLHRAQRRFALEQERREARQLHELDMLKIKLFTNLSHEFKTPVSLIIAPLEEVIAHETDHNFRHKLYLIRRNAKRLLYLANQLMDFRKMEMQELKLNPANGDIIAFIRDVVYSFTDLAERKQVEFSFFAENETLFTSFDHDKMERILFNLLSNAFKFTLSGGSVKVFTSYTQTNDQALLEIRVDDTGIGIPPERHEKIFEQFFHSDSPGGFVNQGSGIGLAITREFIKLCKGTIGVNSEVNRGTTFTLHLPLEILPAATVPPEPAITASLVGPALPEPITPEPATQLKQEEKQTILLVEDNDDFRFYLKENMKAHYHIIEATDGVSGWQKTLSTHPDLVVSDVNMPAMNGLALCTKIKSDNRTRQIPVILLTALTAEEEQLRGLENGADDYIIKPVRFEIMLSRVRNLLTRKAPAKQMIVLPPPDTITALLSADEKFLQKALEIVNKHLSNANFSVEELSRELFMNRVSVYRRIYSITGQPPIEFIRGVRLQRAAQLLAQTEMSVAEVAYEVGFNNPKYFTKYFKMMYQVLPSAYAAAMKKE